MFLEKHIFLLSFRRLSGDTHDTMVIYNKVFLLLITNFKYLEFYYLTIIYSNINNILSKIEC